MAVSDRQGPVSLRRFRRDSGARSTLSFRKEDGRRQESEYRRQNEDKLKTIGHRPLAINHHQSVAFAADALASGFRCAICVGARRSHSRHSVVRRSTFHSPYSLLTNNRTVLPAVPADGER